MRSRPAGLFLHPPWQPLILFGVSSHPLTHPTGAEHRLASAQDPQQGRPHMWLRIRGAGFHLPGAREPFLSRLRDELALPPPPGSLPGSPNGASALSWEHHSTAEPQELAAGHSGASVHPAAACPFQIPLCLSVSRCQAKDWSQEVGGRVLSRILPSFPCSASPRPYPRDFHHL